MNKEKINKLQNEFMDFWDSKKETLNLGEYSDAITQFWLNQIDLAIQEERERIVEVVDDLTWNYKDAGVNELEDNTAYLKVSDLKDKLK